MHAAEAGFLLQPLRLCGCAAKAGSATWAEGGQAALLLQPLCLSVRAAEALSCLQCLCLSVSAGEAGCVTGGEHGLCIGIGGG